MRIILILAAGLLLAGCADDPSRTACVTRPDVRPDSGATRYAAMTMRQDGLPCRVTVPVADAAPPVVLYTPAHGAVTVAAAATPQGPGWAISYARADPGGKVAVGTQQTAYAGGDWFAVSDAAHARTVVVDVAIRP